MNPSSNFGDLNSGFSNSRGDGNPAGSLRSSGGRGVSRPRFVKVRKQSSLQSSKFGAETWAGPGFNPFRPVPDPAGSVSSDSRNRAFLLERSKSESGSKWNVENTIVEDMNNTRIGRQNLNVSGKGGFVFGVDHSKASNIDEDLVQLRIDDDDEDGKTTKGKFGFGIDDNVGGSVMKTVDSALPNDFKTKLNIKHRGDLDHGIGVSNIDNVKMLGAKSNNNGREVLAESYENVLQDRIKNLNIKDSVGVSNVNKSTDTKYTSASENRESIRSYLGKEREDVLINEIGHKLNIGSASGASFDMRETSSSSQKYANLTENKGYQFGDKAPVEFVAKGGLQGKNESGSQVPSDLPKVDTQSCGIAGPSFTFSFSSSTGGNAFGVPLTGASDKMDGFSFTSKHDGVKSSFVEFKTPYSKDTLNQNLDFTSKYRDLKGKKKRGKLKKPTKVHLWPGQGFVSRQGPSQEIPEASESYSPMDISPYQEITSSVQLSREASVASEDSSGLDNQYASNDSQQNVSNDAIDEDLLMATQLMDINGEDVTYQRTNKGDAKFTEPKDEGSEYCFDKGVGADCPLDESISGAETESFKSANEEIDFFDNSTESEASSSRNIERQDSDGRTQYFSVNSDDTSSSGFTFAAPSAAQAASKRHQKKKNLTKVGRDSYSSSSNPKVPYVSSTLQFTTLSGASVTLAPPQGNKVDPSTPSQLVGNKPEVVGLRGEVTKNDPDLITAASLAAQEACEKWRLRGNQAYKSGDLSKAEDCYTQGLNCISKEETSRSCLRALMLCYSNRAATLMSLGRMRDALEDCKMAAAIDPNFLRVQVRAANCYLALGEVEDASEYFNKCLHLGNDVCVDRKIAVGASEGIQKAQQVSDCMQRSLELLQGTTSTDSESALEAINEALCISPYSERLLQMKAELLFMQRKYKDVIQLCEQTSDSAKMNSPPVDVDYQLPDLNGSEPIRETSFRIWRCCLIFKCYFHLGRLEDAIGLLQKLEELDLVAKSDKMQELLIPLATTIRELLHHKTAGNEAFQAGRHSEAIEHYTAALSQNSESRPFAAICFCNRAAAYKALGQITDAIADCSLAIALDGNYLKAISRRATLYEMIRDYGQAANDLQRLVAVLTKQIEEKTPSDRSTNLASELRQARLRLLVVEEESRRDIPLDMYLILGVEPSAVASEIKKAYRKAALRHHPDKAGQSLARSDNGDDGLWKEIGEEVYRDADRLFKMIGEAYAVLSDTTKRSKYDMEEEMRNAQKKRDGSGAYRTNMDAHDYRFERTASRRNWREVWRSYGR